MRWSMRRGRGRRPPSPAAAERLAGAVSREVADLREGIVDDLILALLLHDDDRGFDDAGDDRIRRFHGRLEDAIAAAAVEREAEEVVAAACRRQERPPVLRALAAAGAAALALVAALSVTDDGPSAPLELAADARGAAGDAEAPGEGGVPAGTRPALERFDRGVVVDEFGTEPAVGASDGSQVLRLFDRPAGLLSDRKSVV